MHTIDPKLLKTTNEEVHLALEAEELSPKIGKKKIEEALRLDPDCIEAYEYLGSLENSPAAAMEFFTKGITIGRRLFGGEYLEENKVHFGGVHETRPFMRCMEQYADCLFYDGR